MSKLLFLIGLVFITGCTQGQVLVDDNSSKIIRVNEDGSVTKQQTRTGIIEPFFGDAEGANSPAVDAQETGTCTDNMSWSNRGQIPSYLQTNDTSYVHYSGNSFDTGNDSDGLAISDFGFTTSGTIDGIQVDIINWETQQTANYFDIVLMTSPGTRVGNDKADGTQGIPGSDPGSTPDTFGGSADTWGAGLTSTQVNASTFGVELCYLANGNNTRMNIDYVTITITFTPPVGEEPDDSARQNVYWF